MTTSTTSLNEGFEGISVKDGIPHGFEYPVNGLYDDPDDDALSNIANYPDVLGGSDDEGDEYEVTDDEDVDDHEYVKPLLGSKPADNRDLLRHLRKDKQKRQKHDFNGPLPAMS
jgi:hypothetical protein